MKDKKALDNPSSFHGNDLGKRDLITKIDEGEMDLRKGDLTEARFALNNLRKEFLGKK